MAAMNDDQTAFMSRGQPFAATLGLREVQATAESVAASLAWDQSLCTGSGILHGGALMGLADAVGGYCAYLNLPTPQHFTATIESKTNFLRPVRSGTVRAIARPLHVGRTTIVVDTEVRDDEQRLVARTTQTQAVLPPA
jgi:uncharacterized protein (TIGR00369 family)